ncbi:hypothetical protein BD413DRAFT_579550 [Trametes elegans]|nr:hypothetical protein BD413DRAFT_579550 [Trametes elegans]
MQTCPPCCDFYSTEMQTLHMRATCCRSYGLPDRVRGTMSTTAGRRTGNLASADAGCPWIIWKKEATCSMRCDCDHSRARPSLLDSDADYARRRRRPVLKARIFVCPNCSVLRCMDANARAMRQMWPSLGRSSDGGMLTSRLSCLLSYTHFLPPSSQCWCAPPLKQESNIASDGHDAHGPARDIEPSPRNRAVHIMSLPTDARARSPMSDAGARPVPDRARLSRVTWAPRVPRV